MRTMTPVAALNAAKKRKQPEEPSSQASVVPKRHCAEKKSGPPADLSLAHRDIVLSLEPKYNIRTTSIISSAKIRNRVSSTNQHLLDHDNGVVLLHGRQAEVGKLVTVVEHCKRILKEKGKSVYQYNQPFEVPEALQRTKKPDIVEKTILEDEDRDRDAEEDYFETMQSRFEKAVLPPAPKTLPRSMRVFLSLGPIPELKGKSNVTLQVMEA
jgi:Alba